MSEQFVVLDDSLTPRYVLQDLANSAAPNEAGEESYVDVAIVDGTQRVLFHTGVYDAYAGRGLASVLVAGAVNDVIARGFRIVPVCPYVAKWLTTHPEFAEHVDEPGRAHAVAIRAQQKADAAN